MRQFHQEKKRREFLPCFVVVLLLVVSIRCGIKIHEYIYIYMGSRLASYIGGLSTKIESPYVELWRNGGLVFHVDYSLLGMLGDCGMSPSFSAAQKV